MKLTIVVGLFAIFFALPDAEAQRSSLLLLNPNCPKITPAEGVEIDCDEPQDDKSFVACDECTYRCLPGFDFDGDKEVVRRCEPKLVKDDEDCCSMEMAWSGDEPDCRRIPPTECDNPPYWEEVPPGDIAGWADCKPLSNETGPYPIGYECTYVCPEGFELVGTKETQCKVIDVDAGTSGFSPKSACCQKDCFSIKRDVLFILDRSSSVNQADWWEERNFTIKAMKKLWEGNKNLLFGVEVFGRNVKTEYTLRFTNNLDKLEEDIKDISFNKEKEGGTWMVEALNYAVDTMFNNITFGNRDDKTAPNVVFFLTDGACIDSSTYFCSNKSIEDAAKRVQDNSVDVISVGIGLDKLSEEKTLEHEINAKYAVKTIASSADNNLDVDNFEALDSIVDDLKEALCSDACEGFENLPGIIS